MNYYENIVILDAALEDTGIDAAEKRITDLIEKMQGEVLKHERWGRRKLSYEINKHEKGYYLFFVFKSPPTAIKPLEELYKVFDPVFKFMIIKLRKKEVIALQSSLQAMEAKAAEQAAPDVVTDVVKDSVGEAVVPSVPAETAEPAE
ncbi:MAG: 30S ribosomal protein S6 [Nitrospirae bacterium]|nr:30S ribosomal protein S6 [Nitrospirota bacterium]